MLTMNATIHQTDPVDIAISIKITLSIRPAPDIRSTVFFFDWSMIFPASGPAIIPARSPADIISALTKSEGIFSCINSRFPIIPVHNPKPAIISPVNIIQMFLFFHIPYPRSIINNYSKSSHFYRVCHILYRLKN